jgi:CRP-like cAMP-binding protein
MAALSFVGFLSSLTELSQALLSALNDSLKPELYRNHQVFHVGGQVENRLWYLEEGLVRAYYFDQAGKEHTLQFFSAGDVIFSWQGWYHEPADFYLEALETSKLVSLSYHSFADLSARFAELKTIAQIIMRRRLQTDHFYNRLMRSGAEERYRRFRSDNPGIFRRVSVRLIATHLNMTRENLSKLITHDSRS